LVGVAADALPELDRRACSVIATSQIKALISTFPLNLTVDESEFLVRTVGALPDLESSTIGVTAVLDIKTHVRVNMNHSAS